jgi:hypothetical protein
MASRTSTRPAPSTDQAIIEQPQQLSLLPASELPVQFRLDRRTRERGLNHLAQLRRQLSDLAATRRTWDQAA